MTRCSCDIAVRKPDHVRPVQIKAADDDPAACGEDRNAFGKLMMDKPTMVGDEHDLPYSKAEIKERSGSG